MMKAFKVGFLSGIFLLHVIAAAESPGPSRPGAKRMAAMMAEVYRKSDLMQNAFLARERAEMMGARLKANISIAEKVEIQKKYPIELLNAGESEKALKEFDALERLINVVDPAFRKADKNREAFALYRAIGHLRIAEQLNCLTNHTIDSCIFPIQGGGIHTFQEGSRAAMGVLTNFLNTSTNSLAAVWLLNVAAMTVSEYPQGVPEKWLIPPKLFESEYDIKRFPDIAGPLGLDDNQLSGGTVVDDFDNDGFLDLMFTSVGPMDQMRYFRNNGDGTFSDRTAAAGLIGETGGLNMVQADYNNDGFVDVFILRGGWMGDAGVYPNSLLRNNGDGTFDDVTEEAKILSFHPTQTATWLDYNGDGWIDLYIGNETSSNLRHPCELYRNNGNGTFTECAQAAGVANVGFVKGVVSGDYNNDGRPDLYLSRRGQPNVLYRNDGPRKGGTGSPADWEFTNMATAAGVTEPLSSFPCWFVDYDNDGWQDIFVAGYRIADVGDIAADYLGLPHTGERARLYRNKGGTAFEDVSKEVGLYKVLHGMGSNFGDLDNDGFLDFYIGTGDPYLGTLIPNRMFRNAAGRRFQDVTTSGGFGHLQKGHAVAFADLDNDGDQDIYEDMGGAYTGDIYRNVLFQNPGHGNRWLTLKLEGKTSNRSALGARIKVTVKTPDGERVIRKTVSSGGSFGASPLRQAIGLGAAEAIKEVEIFWPTTGKSQKFSDLKPDRAYKITEDMAQAAPWELKKIVFATEGKSGHEHHHHH